MNGINCVVWQAVPTLGEDSEKRYAIGFGHIGFGTHPLGGYPVLAKYVRARDVKRLRLGQRRENQGVMHSAMHPDSIRAVKRGVLTYHIYVSTSGPPT